MNHYATDQLLNQGGRHYWFVKFRRQHRTKKMQRSSRADGKIEA